MRLPKNTLSDAAVELEMKLRVPVRGDHNQVGLFLPGDIQDRSDRVSQSNAKGDRDVTRERSHSLKLFAAMADRRAVFIQQIRI